MIQFDFYLDMIFISEHITDLIMVAYRSSILNHSFKHINISPGCPVNQILRSQYHLKRSLDADSGCAGTWGSSGIEFMRM